MSLSWLLFCAGNLAKCKGHSTIPLQSSYAFYNPPQSPTTLYNPPCPFTGGAWSKQVTPTPF